jgi:hypothetical protein
MPAIVFQQLRFGMCSRNSGKAIETDGVEGTVSVMSVRVKDDQFIGHPICLFPGEQTQGTGALSGMMVNLAQ